MAKINILDRETAELIAAGEVIDRPASIVKELVENSIDAGASAITVEIRNGGIRLIRVTDNGCGIEQNEVPKAFLRHATSKVLLAQDLERIGTLGFRGEALASICAVSKVELLTRTADETVGTRYTLAGESAGELCEAGCPVGTSITAQDLFYNVPARMKFLKKDSTEGAAVGTLMDRLALSHPEIAFKLIRDRETKLSTPGSGDLLAAIYAVYGTEFGRGLIPVDCTVGSFCVKGYLAKPECCRASRSMEHFFINHRYVRSGTMLSAVEEAYRNHLMTGRFPGCVINLSLDPAQVDVNVHPAKLEVKLSDERSVFDIVFSACKGALSRMERTVSVQDVSKKHYSPFELSNQPNSGEQTRMTAGEYRAMAQQLEQPQKQGMGTFGSLPKKLTASPSLNSHAQSNASLELKSESTLQYVSALPEKGTHYGAVQSSAASPRIREPEIKPPVKAETLPSVAAKQDDKGENTAPQAEPSHVQLCEETLPITLLGELFDTYLLAQQGNQFLLIDKHAAHERILFNRLQEQHRQGNVERQLLLSPVTVTMEKELYDAALRHCGEFSKAGFAIEDFGDGCICVREIPAILMSDCIEDLILELAERVSHESCVASSELFDDLYHSVACKAAIKGNRASATAEQEELLRLLQTDPTVRNCPHGRPVMVAITRLEIEKMFRRIV